MSEHTTLLPENSPELTRRDLITFEHLLQEQIAAFLPFSSYSLFFPRSLEGDGAFAGLRGGLAVHLPDEEKVFLPLAFHGRMLGVFSARGVDLEASDSLPGYLAAMSGACMEKLALYKASITDPLTHCANLTHFSRTIASEIRAIRDCILPGSSSCLKNGSPAQSAGFGILHIELASMKKWQQRFGFSFGDRALCHAAKVLQELAPEESVCAALSDHSLALFWPGGSSVACRELASALASRLASFNITDTILEQEVTISASVGFIQYPTDMTGNVLRQTVREQTGILLTHARHAAAHATPGAPFAFPQIVSEGGRVRASLPLNRIQTSLGAAVGALEGQRFLVWSSDHGGEPGTPSMYKGEIMLVEVRSDFSIADIMNLSDPAWSIAPGDRLTLAPEPEASPAPRSEDGQPHTDVLTGLLQYRDFLDAFTQQRDEHDKFALLVLRLPDPPEGIATDNTETQLRELSAVCSEVFGDKGLGGRFTVGSLIWFLPDFTSRRALSLAKKLHERLSHTDLPLPAIGISAFPYLTFSRADALENVQKALHYAQLLPDPHRAVLDSVGLNISADRLFAQGRLFDAIEEYKLALLSDRTNTTARNSLGICLARIGERSKAKRQFQTVIKRDSKDLFAQYNFGYVCQKMRQFPAAHDAYLACISIDPKHIFSHIRLGELAQREGKYKSARSWFKKASQIAGGEKLTRRYLARLALAQGKPDEAREHLHQALIHDPKDAVSLHLMARLYLDNGEDPQIAEALARQSAALAPQQPAFWKELARALTAQGKAEEAHVALGRARAIG
ncbi:tetratricopeptide repeat protein [Desulfobaculum bizertense]|uniref:tetratricopeptide repeat protein n=1 Tax=Desulfobaculum bizertense TaxID=376490 RepID=UPI001F1F55B4|nr:tetratricopeptide repeat protein [Desulfobaculum bizertense]UIJ37067.1 tetratricopeptide repeat protein [Desulfobaculum bizertense]